MSVVRASGRQLYVLIDEYDSFANRLLSDGEHTLDDFIVQGTGFVRSFYATLKAGTGSGAIARMFITGVSPILLDDSLSGFSILTFISQHPAFNTLAGLTRADVERAVDELLASTPRGSAPIRGSPTVRSSSRLWRSTTTDTGSPRTRPSESSIRTWCSISFAS